MSTELFRVKILKKTATTVLVEATDTYEGLSAPETEAFFFAALHEPAQDTSHPLGQACSVEQMCDEAFVLANTRAYLAGVELMDGESGVTATYLVRFTDAKWCAHLRRGLTWDTASYDLGKPVFGRALEARRAAEKARAKAAPQSTPPSVAAQTEVRTCRVKVGSAGSSGVELTVHVTPPERVPPVTAGFFFRALREELLRGEGTEIQAFVRKLCPDDTTANDDERVTEMAPNLVSELELYGWYGVGQSTFCYRLTFPKKKWATALKSGQTWTTEARDAGPAMLARALTKMTGVKVKMGPKAGAERTAKGAKKAAKAGAKVVGKAAKATVAKKAAKATVAKKAKKR